MTNEELRARMDAEAEAIAAAETDEDDGTPLPDRVTVSRPNRARSKVLQVRLNDDEFEALEAIAARRDLPVSTIAREHLLELVRAERARAAAGDTTALAEQLLLLVSELSSVTEQFREAFSPEAIKTASEAVARFAGMRRSAMTSADG